MTQELTASPASAKRAKPSIFDYLDFRDYLKDAYSYKKAMNPRFSENAFVLAAGFGKNSRGYLGLVIKGKRNLTPKSIIGFSRALDLSAQEAMFFENMTLFCQAEDEKEKVYYFERLKISAQGENSKPMALLDSHLRFLNEWHLVVLREMISLADFKEDIDWIHKRLCGKISKEKITEGLDDLLNLELIKRDQSGKLVQCDATLLFKDGKDNFKNTANLHKDFAQRASQAMTELPYDKRAAQLITLGIPRSKFEPLRKEMQEMTELLLKKYGHETNSQEIVQIGIQLLHITQ